MTDSKNEKLVLEFINALCERDTEQIEALFHDEGTMWVAGTKALLPSCGSFSKREFLHNFDLGSNIIGKAEEVEIFGTTAQKDRVAVEMRAKMKILTGEGGMYDQTFHNLFVVKDGKIFVWKEYFDTHLAAETFKSLGS